MVIRVFIAEDHALFREGTRKMLEQQPDVTVVGEAQDGIEAVERITELRPDVAILDIRMPGLSGVEATKQVLAGSPSTAVLILSAYDDDVYVRALLEAGASGYLLKSVQADELVDSVRLIHRGETVLHPDIAKKLAQLVSKGSDTGNARLTAREMEVVRGVCRGLRNKEIAQEMTVSVKTVEGHLDVIFDKLGVRSRMGVALYARSRGWLAESDPAR